ncbi:MAG: putative oxidoreductase C-terminal domain-containing protein [Bacteroidales bacterium]|nr:putative oxidoreductase C-terminal domain-containing protein [Bacteroidales bacterium]
MKTNTITATGALLLLLASCTSGNQSETNTQENSPMFSPPEGKVKLMNLDPGHFHAALVQKTMYESVDPQVYVYAPGGPELESYLALIGSYNSREEDPTAWRGQVYTGDDFLEKMLTEKPGNVLVVSGNNARKTEYIRKAVQNGIHVLADKPMVITPEEFPLLEEAFATAEEQGVLLYDMMTERYEITTLLQKEFSQLPEVFGELQTGSPNLPAITKESVHHFSKLVSGEPLIRPPWFFDTEQQGEGIVDVTTHLVDLVQWEAFPGEVLRKEDIRITSSKRWTTALTREMFRKVTGLDSYPSFLEKDVDGSILRVYSNGEINYTIKGIHARVSVIWNFQAPEGSGDTHYSTMRGSNCELTIRQGQTEDYKPTLYIMPTFIESPETFRSALIAGVQKVAEKYPGIGIEEVDELTWRVHIPEHYKAGHEAHFGQVTEKYLDYLLKGTLPEWEIPNMIVKYYTTTEGMKQAFDMK